MWFTTILLFAPFLTLATPVQNADDSAILDCAIRTVFEFPNDTYVENLAVRSNGEILLSPLNVPSLYMIDPSRGGQPTIVYSFPEALGLAGISEYEPDVFAVITGNFSFATGDTGVGSWTVWSVDLNGVKLGGNNQLLDSPKIYKISTIAEAHFLNGISLLSEDKGSLLVGDIAAGDIWRLDVKTGVSEVVIQNNLTAIYPAPPFPLAGVDGLHVRDNILYFTNIGLSTFFKVPIYPDGTPSGPFTTVAHTLAPIDEYDDFTFDRNGNAFLVTGAGNSVEIILAGGKRQKIFIGNVNSTAIAEPTSAAFGRHPSDNNVLYVTTAGGLATPVDGHIIIGGQLVAITTPFSGVINQLS
ncbi:hypothetical protein B7463_g1629, partial [Scytalidium lignicola]